MHVKNGWHFCLPFRQKLLFLDSTIVSDLSDCQLRAASCRWEHFVILKQQPRYRNLVGGIFSHKYLPWFPSASVLQKKTPLPILKSLEPNIIAKEYCMYRTMTVLFFVFFFPLSSGAFIQNSVTVTGVCVCVLRILQWLHQSDFKTYTFHFIN